MDTIMGILLIIMGLYFSIFSKYNAKSTTDFYQKLLKVRFNERGYQIGFFLGGIAFIFFGFRILIKNIF